MTLNFDDCVAKWEIVHFSMANVCVKTFKVTDGTSNSKFLILEWVHEPEIWMLDNDNWERNVSKLFKNLKFPLRRFRQREVEIYARNLNHPTPPARVSTGNPLTSTLNQHAICQVCISDSLHSISTDFK